MPALPLSKDQLDDAARLKALFVIWQKKQRDAGLPFSQEAVSEMLGFNQSAMSQYLNGKIPLNIKAAQKFSELIDCPVLDFSPSLAGDIWVISGGNEEQEREQFTRRATPISTEDEDEGDLIAIKSVSIKVQAGFPGFDADREFEDGGVIHIPRKAIEGHAWSPHCLLAIKVRGDSMAPVFANGDTIVINVADRKMVSGEVYAVNCEGNPVVKQLALQGEQWMLRSFNPQYDPKPYRSPDCDIIGKVVYQPGRVVSGRLD